MPSESVAKGGFLRGVGLWQMRKKSILYRWQSALSLNEMIFEFQTFYFFNFLGMSVKPARLAALSSFLYFLGRAELFR